MDSSPFRPLQTCRLVAVPLLAAFGAACVATVPPPPVDLIGAARPPAAKTVVEPCVLLSFTRDQKLSDVVGGGANEPWKLAAATILVRHPAATVLIDAGIGRDTAKDLEKAPFFVRSALGDWSAARPLIDVLREAGIPPETDFLALATHVHWDHVGGLRDLPNARPRLWEPELEFWKKRKGDFDHGVIRQQLEPLEARLGTFAMDGPAYEGFKQSHDFFGDGALVAVPVPGHTPGSTAFFVNSADGKRWLFSGDTTWALDGIRRGAQKPYLASSLVDSDDDVLAEGIAMLRAVHQMRPELPIIPSHDYAALQSLPMCSASK